MHAERFGSTDLDVAVTMLAADARDCPAHLLGQVEVDRLDAHAATPIDTAHIQQVVHQPPHAADLGADDAKVGHLLALAVALGAEAALEELRVALDAGERRAQLMADDREEVVLDALRGLLAAHALLEVRPELRVLERRACPLGNRLGHPPQPFGGHRPGRARRGQHAEQPPTGHDRHGQHPGKVERGDAVGVAGRYGVARALY